MSGRDFEVYGHELTGALERNRFDPVHGTRSNRATGQAEENPLDCRNCHLVLHAASRVLLSQRRCEAILYPLGVYDADTAGR